MTWPEDPFSAPPTLAELHQRLRTVEEHLGFPHSEASAVKEPEAIVPSGEPQIDEPVAPSPDLPVDHLDQTPEPPVQPTVEPTPEPEPPHDSVVL